MARSRVIMERLEEELDAMHSSKNEGVADNEAEKIEHDIATILFEMNHLRDLDPYNNEEEEQQQPELATCTLKSSKMLTHKIMSLTVL